MYTTGKKNDDGSSDHSRTGLPNDVTLFTMCTDNGFQGKVKQVDSAVNHSLLVTLEGYVYATGHGNIESKDDANSMGFGMSTGVEKESEFTQCVDNGFQNKVEKM